MDDKEISLLRISFPAEGTVAKKRGQFDSFQARQNA